MQCPECKSTHIRKNGIKKGKQNHKYHNIFRPNALLYIYRLSIS
jgi:hypothetical protein